MLAPCYNIEENFASDIKKLQTDFSAELINPMQPLLPRHVRVNDKAGSLECLPFGTSKDGKPQCNWRRLLMGQMGWQAMCRKISWSVADIGDTFGVSRQAVYKNVKYAAWIMPSIYALPDSVEYKITMDEKNVEKVVISLIMDGHCSFDNAHRVLASMLGEKAAPCPATIYKIIAKTAKWARKYMESILYDKVKRIACDEIFLANGKPVMAVICLDTTAVLCIMPMNDRKSETWELIMSLLKDQGLNIETSVSDAGKGLLSGIKAAFPDADIQIDVFHVQKDLGAALRSFYNMIDAKIKRFIELDDKVKALRSKRYSPSREKRLKSALKALKEAENGLDEAFDDSKNMECLQEWIRETMSLSGNTYDEAMELLKWLLSEVKAIATKYSFHKVNSEVYRLLDKLDNVMVFLQRLFRKFQEEADKVGIPEEAFCLIHRRNSIDKDKNPKLYEAMTEKVRQLVGLSDITHLESAHDRIVESIKRASSLIENLNSRLRVYMNIRHHMPEDFCYLLALYTNLKKYHRSRNETRNKRSPMEILTGEKDLPELVEFLEQQGFWEEDEQKVA